MTPWGFQFWRMQAPIMIEVGEQQTPPRDISIDTALNIFLMPFVVLLVLALGGALVGGVVVLYKRWRDATRPGAESEQIRLGL